MINNVITGAHRISLKMLSNLFELELENIDMYYGMEDVYEEEVENRYLGKE